MKRNNFLWIRNYMIILNDKIPKKLFKNYMIIFTDSDWIRRDMKCLSVFSPNTGKYGPENFQIRTLLTEWQTDTR